MQSRLDSVLEACANTAIGYVVALATQLVTFWLYDIHTPFSTNLKITAWFTLVSLLRSYALRRWFNLRNISNHSSVS